MKRLAGWTSFVLVTIVAFVAMIVALNLIGRHYSAFSELWMLISAICLFSTVVAILAAGKAQAEEDARNGF